MASWLVTLSTHACLCCYSTPLTTDPSFKRSARVLTQFRDSELHKQAHLIYKQGFTLSSGVQSVILPVYTMLYRIDIPVVLNIKIINDPRQNVNSDIKQVESKPEPFKSIRYKRCELIQQYFDSLCENQPYSPLQ